MKTFLTVTTALLLMNAANVKAQSPAGKKESIHVGARAGVNLSNVIKSGDNTSSTGSKVGFNAAAFVEIPIITGFSFQPELQFSQKGFKETGSFLGSPYEYRQTLNFIEVPLLAKFKPSKNFGIFVGPQFSFLSSTQTKFLVNNSSFENNVKQDNDNLRKNTLGGVLGIEGSANNFVVNFRYNIDLQNNRGDGTSSTPKYKNQVFSLGVGFIF